LVTLDRDGAVMIPACNVHNKLEATGMIRQNNQFHETVREPVGISPPRVRGEVPWHAVRGVGTVIENRYNPMIVRQPLIHAC
jgi:hypothetical protein